MIKSVPVAEQVVMFLLDIGAIKINMGHPFTWASGWKSPIYCDNRISLSYPIVRNYIKERLSAMIKDRFEKTEAIAGVATAGIPQGTLVADLLGLPFLYVRSKPKEHGLSNQIEGKARAGQKVVVIEDLVSTGGSSMKAIEALRDAEMEVMGMVSIFTYSFKQAMDLFTANKVTFYSLSNYQTLIRVALSKGYVQEEEVKQLKAWRKDPAHWG
jgi:orotate phosphoribosyltransferase